MRKLVRVGSCSRCSNPSCCEGCLQFESPNICTIYDTRGTGCQNRPPHPFERPDYCTFYFFDLETGEEVVGYKNRALLNLYEVVS